MSQQQQISTGALFEPAYLALREKEGRLYTDDELRRLPDVPPQHPYAAEWRMRRRSARRLCRWLARQQRPLRVLEVGCGNGWLAQQLAGVPGCTVVGTDVNRRELEQAARVFVRSNLFFTEAGLQAFEAGSFDVVLFAASLQYFPSLRATLDEACALLKPGGALHVLDTYFYGGEEAPAAAARSRAYFASMGCAEMAGHYFHHGREGLAPFGPQLQNRAALLLGGLFGGTKPFPWYLIPKPATP
ncbi:MAG: class I SAM-dependent methyltransferase [Chitinophagaceae bacterium]|nr:MAG: class I SAM-dependent methyltransferase [Chitinophagaceae bacterium]